MSSDSRAQWTRQVTIASDSAEQAIPHSLHGSPALPILENRRSYRESAMDNKRRRAGLTEVSHQTTCMHSYIVIYGLLFVGACETQLGP